MVNFSQGTQIRTQKSASLWNGHRRHPILPGKQGNKYLVTTSKIEEGG
jgi:hypothetical protein